MHTSETSRKKVEAHNFVQALSTGTLTLVPEKTAAQRLRAFMEQMRAGNYPSDFAYHKTFDYALSLPSIYKLKSTTERLEAAVALLNEVSAQLSQEQEDLLNHQKLYREYVKPFELEEEVKREEEVRV